MRNVVTGLAVWSTLAAGCAAEVVLYSQPTTTNVNNVGLCYYSSSVPRPTRNYKHADDFVVATGGQVEKVRWWGIGEGRFFKNLANVDQFTIEFYQAVPDQAGLQVGALIQSATFAIAETNQTATGRLNKRNSAIEYRHEVMLPVPLNVEAGSAYFIAISARPVNPLKDAWGWQDGLMVNGYSQIYSYETQQWSSFQDTDSSFELFGTVPAPGAGSGAMVLVLGLGRRRRA